MNPVITIEQKSENGKNVISVLKGEKIISVSRDLKDREAEYLIDTLIRTLKKEVYRA